MELRPYQKEAVAAIEGEWDAGRRSTLLVLPTGAGKTIIFASVIGDMARQGKRSLVLAHRGELLTQAADKIRAVTGMRCSVEKADQTCVGEWYFTTVGSVQTLMRDKRLDALEPNRFDVIVVDEAHHALADSYRKVLDHFDTAKILGVTATPDRADRRNLGAVFESLAYEYTLPRAIKEGYLCPIKAQTIPLTLDISMVKQSNGDYSVGDLGSALDPYLESIADEMIKAGCEHRRTVVFLPLVATSKKFRSILESRGLAAAEVNGESPDRAEILADFDRGAYQVLCNSMLLTEGWDCPAVDCIVVLRATRSRPLYCQMVGRGCRLSPETGKDHLLLLDFLWHTATHELCRPAHLVAESDEVAEAMTERINDAQCALDLEEVETTAKEDVVREREEKLAEELRAMRNRKRKLVDPLQFEMSIAAEDLSGYVPAFPWEMAPVSDKQRASLEKFGIFPDDVECAGKATMLLDRLGKRRDSGLTTPKQIRLLERYGFKHVGTWRFDDASKMIGRISALGWRLPTGIDPANYNPIAVEPDRAGTLYDPEWSVQNLPLFGQG